MRLLRPLLFACLAVTALAACRSDDVDGPPPAPAALPQGSAPPDMPAPSPTDNTPPPPPTDPAAPPPAG